MAGRVVMPRVACWWRQIGGGELAAHVEFDFAGQLNDGFGVMAVLEQRVFDGLRAVDEQAAVKAVLFLGDPVAAAVPADKDDAGWRTARWRFDELHVGIPSEGESRAFRFGRRRDPCPQYLLEWI
jgi:hypothetical protein